MKFSQELVDDTILPKMDMSDMSMKNKMGKSAKPTVVAKNATSQKSIQIYSINDTVNVYLSDCSLKNNECFGLDLFDYETNEIFGTMMDRDKLRGLADFIYKYLENN